MNPNKLYEILFSLIKTERDKRQRTAEGRGRESGAATSQKGNFYSDMCFMDITRYM